MRNERTTSMASLDCSSWTSCPSDARHHLWPSSQPGIDHRKWHRVQGSWAEAEEQEGGTGQSVLVETWSVSKWTSLKTDEWTSLNEDSLLCWLTKSSSDFIIFYEDSSCSSCFVWESPEWLIHMSQAESKLQRNVRTSPTNLACVCYADCRQCGLMNS